MSASQSFLSSPDYGYDYVVAVTQDSINATALSFLSTNQPVVNVCYIYDDNGDPEQIEYGAFKKKANGADPFNIAESGPDREALLKNLDAGGFMFGFRAAMGLPEGFEVFPDIVTLGPAAEDPIIYRLLCKNFLLVELNQIPHKKPVFHTFAQPKGPDGEPWIFTYKVRLVPGTVKDNKAFLKTPAFGNLPASVQHKLTDKPEDFTIQHLLFDFSKAASESRPEISGVNPKLREKLYEDFAIKYFTEMEAAGAPILAVTPSRGDSFAGLQTTFSVNPSPAQPKVTTLNYLCATAGHALPPAKPFTWNWVEPDKADNFDGVCVINRSNLVEHFKSQLASYVDQNCWLPHPVRIYVTLTEADVGFLVVNRNYSFLPKPLPSLEQDFKLLEPANGPLLLHWQFSASRLDEESYYDHGGGDSWLKVDTSFQLKVSCSGKTLTIEQHVLVHYHLVIQTLKEDTTLVDVRITDTFTLAAAGDRLTAFLSPNKVDNSKEPEYWRSVPKLQDQMNYVKDIVRKNISSRLFDVPLSLINGVIFPGGKGFFFMDVAFSDHQDLVAHINYADPN